MNCCKGRYCLALLIIVFSWLFILCKKYFVLKIYFHISYYHCVTCMCIVWLVSLYYPTRVFRFETRPPKRPDGDLHNGRPRYFQQVTHSSPGDDCVGSVDFVLRWIQQLWGIKVIFSIMNLYSFLKCITSDIKSLSSLWFDMCSVCYFCAITCTGTEVASGFVNASNRELKLCVWCKFIWHLWNKFDSWNQVNPTLSNFWGD